MVDRVQRDVDIVTEKTQKDKQSEDVIVDELTVSTHTIVFANSGGTGNKTDGTQQNQVDLNGAPAKGAALGSNAIILADGGAGTIGVTGPLQLSAGQALIGGGSIVPLTGAKTGKTVDFQFGGSRPTLAGSVSTANLVQMAPGTQNEVFGVNLTGAMYNGVFGLNMERAIVKNSLIDTPDGTGLLFLQESTTNYGGPQLSSFVHAESNTVTGGGVVGIAVVDLVSDGNAHTQTVIIDRNTVTSNAADGIVIVNEVGGAGSAMSQALAIRYNVISGNGDLVTELELPTPAIPIFGIGSGVLVYNNVYSGGALAQVAVIAGNAIVDHANDGIHLRNQVGSGGTVGQALTIDGNSIALASDAGIALYNHVSGAGAALSQSLEIESNTIHDIGGEFQEDASGEAEGIFIGNRIYDHGVATQGVTIAHNQISNVVDGGYAYGIRAVNRISGGGIASQTMVIVDNDVAAVSAFNLVGGIDAVSYVTGAASTLSQALTIASNTVTDIAAVRILAVSTVPLIGRKAFGIAVGSLAYYGATVTQSLTIASNQVSGVNAFLTAFGVVVGNNASANGAVLDQSAAILDNQVTQIGSSVSANGITFANSAYYHGSIRAQQVTIAGNVVSNVVGVSAFGIIAGNNVTSDGASIGQNLVIASNTVTGVVGSASAAGIAVANTAYLGVVSQALDLSSNRVAHVSYDALSTVGGLGIVLFNSASSGTILQDLPIGANSVTDVGGDAIRLENHVVYSVVSQTGTITGNVATSNGGAGLSLYNSASGAGAIDFVSLSITNNNFSLDDAGVNSIATAAGGAIVDVHASLNGNSIDNNTTDGIFVFASGAGATETVSLGASDNVNFNTGFGVHLITAGGGAIFFTTDGATITGNSSGNFHTGP
jgi:hypothetical protein